MTHEITLPLWNWLLRCIFACLVTAFILEYFKWKNKKHQHFLWAEETQKLIKHFEDLQKEKACRTFDEFLDYLHESGRIDIEEWEDNQWRKKFKNKLWQQN